MNIMPFDSQLFFKPYRNFVTEVLLKKENIVLPNYGNIHIYIFGHVYISSKVDLSGKTYSCIDYILIYTCGKMLDNIRCKYRYSLVAFVSIVCHMVICMLC